MPIKKKNTRYTSSYSGKIFIPARITQHGVTIKVGKVGRCNALTVVYTAPNILQKEHFRLNTEATNGTINTNTESRGLDPWITLEYREYASLDSSSPIHYTASKSILGFSGVGRYRNGEKCECFTRAQFTRSVSHDGRDRVNHRRKLRRVFYAQTASTNLRFFLGKDNRRYSVRTYVRRKRGGGRRGRKKGGGEGRIKQQTRVPQTYLYKRTIILYTLLHIHASRLTKYATRGLCG